MKKLLFTLSLLSILSHLLAQTGNVGIGTMSPDPSAALDITSTDKGLLIPKVDTAAIMAPIANGLMVYQPTDNTFYYYKLDHWEKLGTQVDLVDADGDTKISLDEGARDSINFSIDGVDHLKLVKGIDGSFRIEMLNNDDNTAIGYQALHKNRDGDNNIATGNKALHNNLDGNNNIATGNQALYTNVGAFGGAFGSDNIATGTNALYSNSAGNNSVAYGSHAGYHSLDNNNTFLGYYSGYNNTGINNIFLGASSGYNEAGNNKLYIESSDADSTGALIYGEFDSDFLRFNGEVVLRDGWVDGDGDTKITLDEGVRDSINFSIDGTQYLKMVRSPAGTGVLGSPAPGTFRLDLPNNGDNIGIGEGALRNNLIDIVGGLGLLNIAIGTSALRENISGSSNVATGNATLRYNTIGSHNVATGNDALSRNVSGSHNVATGSDALVSNVSGSNNLATGSFALFNNISGSHNVATGTSALFRNESGSHNVATGNDALFDNKIGSYNVAIGNRAGGSETSSHKLYIESSSTSQDSTTSLIYGEFDKDSLRFNAAVNINGNYILPTTGGTAGQVITANADGTTEWRAAATTFETVNGLVRNIGDHATEDFVFGSDELPQNGVSTYDTLMFFDKSKGAFRAGAIYNSPSWAIDSIGTQSFASGYNTKAIGLRSTAMGSNTRASGNNSVAMGNHTEASGSISTAMGNYTEASETASIAMGNHTEASSFASIAMGNQTEASGFASTAMGNHTEASAYGETALGAYNTVDNAATSGSWVSTDRLFTIGNGTSSGNRSDAMIVYKNGNVRLNGEVVLRDGWVDADGDTKITLDEGVRDSINFRIDGIQYLKMVTSPGLFSLAPKTFRLDVRNNGDNIGIGTGTLSNNLIDEIAEYGIRNIAIGTSALSENTIGSGNVATGHRALFRNEGGSDNVATGRIALSNNISGRENVATGSNALLRNESGSNNVATGHGALLDNRIGSYNVAIGNRAGGSETSSHKLYIESSSTTQDSTTSLIYGEFDKDSLRFNAAVNINGNYILPTTSGIQGQVITANADGTTEWSAAASTFETVNGLVRNTGDHTTEDFVFGSDELPLNGVSTYDTLMFFDKSKGAFRAGVMNNSTNWSTASIGPQSFASGFNTKASGQYSVAMTEWSKAQGISSVALGRFTDAAGDYSIALGRDTDALGVNSTTMGRDSKASGENSTAFGFGTDASGRASTAMGKNTEASGENATAIGFETDADAFNEVVVGSYNTIDNTANSTSWVSTDRLFTIGNGSSAGNRSDAMVVLKSGRVGLGATPESRLTVKQFSGVVGGLELIRGSNDNRWVMSNDGDLRLYEKSGAGFGASHRGTFQSGTGMYTWISDRRVKEDIRDFAIDMTKIKKLKPARYQYINDHQKNEHIGFIAQELEAIYPEFVVKPANDDEFYTVNYAGLSVVAIAAIQEQQKVLEQQKERLLSQGDRIAKLEAERAEQSARMAKLEAALQTVLANAASLTKIED